jgi:hypothetical protein
MEPSKYCASKNEEKLYLYRTEGFLNTKILPTATAQYHSTYWRTVIPGYTLDSIIFPIPGGDALKCMAGFVSEKLGARSST